MPSNCFYATGLPEGQWETFPVARKEHTCCECGETIRRGETYNLFRGVWDGAFDTYKTCTLCNRVREDLIAEEGCVEFGALWDAADS